LSTSVRTFPNSPQTNTNPLEKKFEQVHCGTSANWLAESFRRGCFGGVQCSEGGGPEVRRAGDRGRAGGTAAARPQGAPGRRSVRPAGVDRGVRGRESIGSVRSHGPGAGRAVGPGRMAGRSQSVQAHAGLRAIARLPAHHAPYGVIAMLFRYGGPLPEDGA